MTQSEDAIIEQALLILELRLRARAVFSDPDAVKSFLRLQSRGLAQEIFTVMYLDGQRRLIGYERHESTDARKIAEKALNIDAAAVIVHHNHADECCWPTLSEYERVAQIQEALNLIAVSVLDHVITSSEGMFSTAKRRPR